MDNSSTKSMENEVILQVEPSDPMVDENAAPLTHVIGNEYDMTWRSVWIHGTTQSVRLVETGSGMKNRSDGETVKHPIVDSCENLSQTKFS